MTTRSMVTTAFFLLLTTVSSRALQSEVPTAQDCRVHIEEALKNYIAGQKDESETVPISDIYTRAEYDDENISLQDDTWDTQTVQPETDEANDQLEIEPPEDEEEEESERQERDIADSTDGEDEDNDNKDEDKPEEHTHDDDDEEDDDDDDNSSKHPVDEHDTTPESASDDDEDDEEKQQDDDDIEDQIERPSQDGQDADDGEEEEQGEDKEVDDGEEEEHGEDKEVDDGEEEEHGEDKEVDDGEEEEHVEDKEIDDEEEEEHGEDKEIDDGEEEEHGEQDNEQDDEQEENHDKDTTDIEEQDENDDNEDVEGEDRKQQTNEDEVSETDEEDEDEEDEGTKEDEDSGNHDNDIFTGPGLLKTREHIDTILGLLEDDDVDKEQEKIENDILKEIKRMQESAVRPLENLYKFKDISNRQMGDAEIFSKPMVMFMGPWSTGKSAIINYLLGTEYSRYALKTGAEPTSNCFTVITYGDTHQVMEGTQLAADWTFSTLQKFGQTFLDHLRGHKMPNPLLKKMTIVDTPGILENRKSTERQYPFNDAFQWFIDRADIIYIVFDPTKLDIGLEMEALFDQLKGRETQVRILLNKADTVKPQELMKVQGTLLWTLSPLLGTNEAPTVYVASLWSRPYLPGSPVTLLDAQEQAFLEDIDDTLSHCLENKVAQARRHAVRVRNHAKMVDCYLTTYYNHKSFFSNKRKVADDIIDNPQNYHIYEGLSTLTNVSRYDLPDPDIYREFFRIHPLFDFKPLASTCSYFKGCPLDKLDIAIAYDLPELVGKYQRLTSNKSVIGGR